MAGAFPSGDICSEKFINSLNPLIPCPAVVTVGD